MFSVLGENGRYDITRCLLSLIKDDGPPPVIMCLGNSFLKGDNFGPAVGDLLIYRHNIRTYVYGCKKRPLTPKNLLAVFGFIKKTHKAKILAIDAGVGNENGNVTIYRGGISPAAYKNMPPIGDYSLICDMGRYFKDTVSTPLQRKDALEEAAKEVAAGVSDALMLHRASRLNQQLINGLTSAGG